MDAARFWSDDGGRDLFAALTPLPPGYARCRCPQCGSRRISGALLRDDAGCAIVASADELDPCLLCLGCHFWADSFG